jgi:hypothetical protein
MVAQIILINMKIPSLTRQIFGCASLKYVLAISFCFSIKISKMFEKTKPTVKYPRRMKKTEKYFPNSVEGIKLASGHT